MAGGYRGEISGGVKASKRDIFLLSQQWGNERHRENTATGV